jgi:hypothetical protein
MATESPSMLKLLADMNSPCKAWRQRSQMTKKHIDMLELVTAQAKEAQKSQEHEQHHVQGKSKCGHEIVQ